ncbi:Serine/threonine-protein kinase AfsK [Streptomyces sp. S4.7]|uniref:serine/threonine-protein kinase n=1 Tax=Streptomyces sp. S4.7 TaxID=2705439 RepID=UPI0013992FBA|nr:serine/threonine-protein kinase [Streptomyces sp. S4.7]QHY97465.1 Serine/threonine-protein kinase AfsK [Streptomyces sp. S4.7]
MQPLDADGPRTIGAYRLLGRLGAGGMGRVYLARSEGGRTVAVKVIHPHLALSEEFRARFRREVAAARRVGGAWTAPVLDADPEAQTPWVATGYVAGPSLTQAVATYGPLPERTVRALGAGLAEALGAVHELGLVHRDVKPSNVLLALDGPRLIDFGIARATDGTASLTSTGVSVGSPGYMSPEQILGKGVTGAADVFSLGAVLAYATAGASPFPGDSSAALLYKVVHEEPELDSLEGELRELVAHCLAKDPAARPAPAEVAALLAPGGAAPLVDAGWLPDPLVREVSRTAVQLLDLETARPAPSASGPAVHWPTPPPPDTPPQSAGHVPTAGHTSAAGHPPTAANPVPVAAGSAPPPGEFGAPTYPDALAHPGGPAGPRAADGRPEDARDTRDPRMSLSVTAGRAGPGRRGVSCTVALAVAGALAAVTLGGTLLIDQFSDNKTSDSADQGPAATGPSASATRDAATGPLTAVPKEFVGTWKGPTTEEKGLPHGDYTVEITAGEKGEKVLRSTSFLSLLGVEAKCHGVGTLVSATAKEIKVEESTDPDRPGSAGMCTTTQAAELTFTLTGDGDLRFASREEEAGNPTGTLRKQ